MQTSVLTEDKSLIQSTYKKGEEITYRSSKI